MLAAFANSFRQADPFVQKKTVRPPVRPDPFVPSPTSRLLAALIWLCDVGVSSGSAKLLLVHWFPQRNSFVAEP